MSTLELDDWEREDDTEATMEDSNATAGPYTFYVPREDGSGFQRERDGYHGPPEADTRN